MWVIKAKNFNLLVSTSRYNETNARAELWFTLFIAGDTYPIISNLEFLGLLTALSNIDAKLIVKKIKEILDVDPNFFKFILKIVPIDFVCETNLKVISQIVKNHYTEFIDKSDTFKIDLKRRKNDIIERERLIKYVANNIDNQVDLQNPDKIIRVELLGNFCGIAFLKPEEVISLKSEF
ncbi:MAG: THUMP domain-containing protein [Promethearchaeota archaeon]